MDLDVVLRALRQAIEVGAAHSSGLGRWVISVPHLTALMEQDIRVSQALNGVPLDVALAQILAQGAESGFWQMNFDHEFEVETIVFHDSGTIGD